MLLTLLLWYGNDTFTLKWYCPFYFDRLLVLLLWPCIWTFTLDTVFWYHLSDMVFVLSPRYRIRSFYPRHTSTVLTIFIIVRQNKEFNASSLYSHNCNVMIHSSVVNMSCCIDVSYIAIMQIDKLVLKMKSSHNMVIW